VKHGTEWQGIYRKYDLDESANPGLIVRGSNPDLHTPCALSPRLIFAWGNIMIFAPCRQLKLVLFAGGAKTFYTFHPF
jgi:hypothetical protein